MNPITRVKEYIQYQKALKSMQKCVERQKELCPDKDGGLSGDEKRLFDLYLMSFLVHLKTVTEYQAKYCAN